MIVLTNAIIWANTLPKQLATDAGTSSSKAFVRTLTRPARIRNSVLKQAVNAGLQIEFNKLVNAVVSTGVSVWLLTGWMDTWNW